MQFRQLGSTGIRVSVVSFGAGPVPNLMTATDRATQRQTLRRALDAGVNWIDTAATYGNGQSEDHVGSTLRELGAVGLPQIQEAHELSQRLSLESRTPGYSGCVVARISG